jgi:hypothetical protein
MMNPPRPRSAIAGRYSCPSSSGARQFMSTARIDSSGSWSSKGPSGTYAALHTTRPTSRPRVAAATLRMPSIVDRSAGTGRASVGSLPASASSGSGRRATSTTRSPRAESAWAKAAPIPSDAPAISAHGPYFSAKLTALLPPLGVPAPAPPLSRMDGIGASAR